MVSILQRLEVNESLQKMRRPDTRCKNKLSDFWTGRDWIISNGYLRVG